MNKKSSVKKTAAILLGLALTVGSVGCNNFILTDNEKDLAQTVATVNIAEALAKEDPSIDKAALSKTLSSLTTDIKKRDLVAYFLSTGYQYVQSYGYTYEDTFNMLMDGLISREIMIQYAIAYYMKKHAGEWEKTLDGYKEEQLAAASAKEKELLKAHPEVLTLKYFLTEGGSENTDYDRAIYSLKQSLNSSLDSLEQSYIKAESHNHEEGEARTLPTGVNTEKEDYYTNDYDIYTGRNTLDSCGTYEKQDGSTTSTRKKAYNAFLANLQSYNMISTAGSVEDTSDITNLDYYYVELSSLLGQALVNKYFDELEQEVAGKIDGAYAGVKYKEIYEAQERLYKNDPAAFATAMDGVSDSSFLLYGLKDFGYVYNILLPFSTSQNIEYTRAKNNTHNTQDDLYVIRKNILKDVQGKDLRGSWISDDEHSNYSYTKEETVGESTVNKYYFFKDQLNGDESTKYESLKQYLGTYAYKGSVEEVDGELKATPDKIKIDEFISEFETHIKSAVGDGVSVVGNKVDAYNTNVYTDDKDKVDYSKFTYYTGKVNVTAAAKDYFNADSDIYKAVSAVNELMFAYSTDTGCLNTYYGYSVSPNTTNFVKEFEYAAQQVVKNGAGSYAVCATDYGWHIVFASFVYTADGKVYGDYVESEAETKGTFSNLFYESLKSTTATSYSTEVQNNVLNGYNNDGSVTRYQSRYQDLLDLDD